MQTSPITELLAEIGKGERAADSRFIAAVMARLEQIAAREMAALNRGGLHGLTMEPQMLAHDALLKVLQQPMQFENRRHFFSFATTVMVNALIDYQRRRRADKRGGSKERVSLSGLERELSIHGNGDLDVEAMPQVLDELEALDSRKADLVRLRVFWGATMDEIADILSISLSSAERDWRFARRWLAHRLDPPDAPPS